MRMLTPDFAYPPLPDPRPAPHPDPYPYPYGDDTGCVPLPHHPKAGPQARRTARGSLESWRVPAETADDVLLVVSELVTNALSHALPDVCMHLTRLPCGTVRVEVADGGPCGYRAERDPDACGRGLALVEALASAYGRAVSPEGALSWAEFAALGRVPGPRVVP